MLPANADSDPDPGDSLSAVLVGGGTTTLGGSVSLNADGTFTYTPPADTANVDDSFTYYVTDGYDNSTPTTVTISLTNEVPVANPDGYQAGHNVAISPAIGTIEGVQNENADTDADAGDSLSAFLVGDGTTALGGSVTLNADGTFTYTPPADIANTDDSFSYYVTDGYDNSDPTTVTIYLTNQAPFANGGWATTPKEVFVDISEVTAAGSVDIMFDLGYDMDGDELAVASIGSAEYGDIDPIYDPLDTNRIIGFTYTPTDVSPGTASFDNSGFDAAFDSFTYIVTDGYNNSVPDTEHPGLVTINLTNQLPVAQPDSYDAIQNVTFSTTVDQGIITGLLPATSGDFDVDGDNLTPYLPGGTTFGPTNYNGSVILNSDGSFAYDPPAAWDGIDSFSYYVNDGYSNSSPALVTINVEVIREPVSEEASTTFTPVTPDVGDIGQIEGTEMANLQWLAEELGLCEGDMSEEEQNRCQELTQAYLAGSFLQATDLRPHQAASQLRLLAELLHDADGSRVTALGRVVEEFVGVPVPPSEEQISLITTALSEHTNDGTHYAAAGEWLDSLSEYVVLLNTEIGWPKSECVEFVMGKYCTTVTESGDIRMAAFIQMHLEAFGG